MKAPIMTLHTITTVLSLSVILISFNIVPVSAIIDITVTDVPATISLDPRQEFNTISGTLTVSSDSSNGWTVSVADAKSDGKTHDGHMQEYNGGVYGTRFLANNMTVSGNSDFEQYVTDTQVTLTGLPNSKILEETGVQVTSISIPLTFTQHVAYSDATLSSGTYRIVIQFDAAETA